MGLSICEKIISKHRLDADSENIKLKIDQTLTQDATGTMAFLQFEALNCEKVETELSVSYIDHNTLQTTSYNANDHEYLRTASSKYGVKHSLCGNGICHQIHLERFAKPAKTLLGSDSHTPNAGGIGMLAFGAGGLDVALAMAGMPLILKKPKITGVKLSNKLNSHVGAKDIMLYILSILGVKGGVGHIFEYFGDGVLSLDIFERATITNMGAELGATSSIFPSDEITKKFLTAQGRGEDYIECLPDTDAVYDRVLELDLSTIEPLAATPHSPGNISKVSDVEGIKVDQVCIGSCTNSSYPDLSYAAKLLDGKKIHPNLSLTISCGSRQVFMMLSDDGSLKKFIKAGARILECACGPCIGMGQSPKSGGVSVRTFNRNFKGRSGTEDAQIFLCGIETAIATALTGKLTHPQFLGEVEKPLVPTTYFLDDSMILEPMGGEIIRGPNIKALPLNTELPQNISKQVLIKLGDDITTDDIMPAGSKILPLRSNIPEISNYVFEKIDINFSQKALDSGGGIIVAGQNYGQGSSREHAALAPMYLGVKIVIAKSFARIHRNNLINFGILPLIFHDEKNFEKISLGITVSFDDIGRKLTKSTDIEGIVGGEKMLFTHDLSPDEIDVIKAGGLLNYTRNQL